VGPIHRSAGIIALEYALRHAERISRLILSGTTSAFDYREEIAANARRKGATEEQLRVLGAEAPDEAAWRRQLRVVEPLYWHDFDADLHSRVFTEMVLSIDAHEAGVELLERWDVTARLGEIHAPTLILVGSDDFITPPSRAEIMHEGSPNSELVVLERSGHWPYLEEPEAYLGAVRIWLGST
jgi:proline iminopeptidase